MHFLFISWFWEIYNFGGLFHGSWKNREALLEICVSLVIFSRDFCDLCQMVLNGSLCVHQFESHINWLWLRRIVDVGK